MSEAGRTTLTIAVLVVVMVVGSLWARRPQIVVLPDRVCTITHDGSIECKDIP